MLTVQNCCKEKAVAIGGEQFIRTSGHRGSPVKLVKGGAATTKVNFKPPVEILIEAKTNAYDLRIGYAASQVIASANLKSTRVAQIF